MPTLSFPPAAPIPPVPSRPALPANDRNGDRAADRGPDHTSATAGLGAEYRTLDLVATSPTSLPDAIENALTRAAGLVGDVDWFELRDLRGTVAEGRVGRWQVGVRIGYREGASSGEPRNPAPSNPVGRG